MTEEITIQAAPRTVVGKQVRALRREGMVPGTVYGPGVSPYNIQMNGHDLELNLHHLSGTQLITLMMDGQTVRALPREVQRNPIRGNVVHIDFYAVNMTTRMTAEVPLHFSGHPAPVQRGEAVVLHGLTTVEVECLPADLPAALEVDLGVLDSLEDAIYVRDLQVPNGVEIREDPEELIARLTPVTAEAEEEVAPVSPEVEIISRPRAEEEEE